MPLSAVSQLHFILAIGSGWSSKAAPYIEYCQSPYETNALMLNLNICFLSTSKISSFPFNLLISLIPARKLFCMESVNLKVFMFEMISYPQATIYQ